MFTIKYGQLKIAWAAVSGFSFEPCPRGINVDTCTGEFVQKWCPRRWFPHNGYEVGWLVPLHGGPQILGVSSQGGVERSPHHGIRWGSHANVVFWDALHLSSRGYFGRPVEKGGRGERAQRSRCFYDSKELNPLYLVLVGWNHQPVMLVGDYTFSTSLSNRIEKNYRISINIFMDGYLL